MVGGNRRPGEIVDTKRYRQQPIDFNRSKDLPVKFYPILNAWYIHESNLHFFDYLLSIVEMPSALINPCLVSKIHLMNVALNSAL